MTHKVALVMAGGTGGHIFPGLAVAHGLRAQGWEVHWLGGPAPSMESELVPPQGFPFEPIAFGGVRGKGLQSWFWLPLRLLRAFWQAWRVVRRLRPQVVLGLGGYITFPGGMMAVLSGSRLLLHEQNAVAGLANKVLAQVADAVYTAFPKALPQAQWIGNPLRQAFLTQDAPETRFAQRQGPLRLLIVGGSLGAQALNRVVPQALALLPEGQRPLVTHQSGTRHIEALREAYAAHGVQAELTPFIQDTARAFAQADVVIARAGASTVTELAAVGVAALWVPYPYAVDDHQTTNARFLTDAGAGWLQPESELTPQGLAQWLAGLNRTVLLRHAQEAYAQRQVAAVQTLVQACEACVQPKASA